MSRFALGLSLAATLASGQALAADLLQWQDNSLTYLDHGSLGALVRISPL